MGFRERRWIALSAAIGGGVGAALAGAMDVHMVFDATLGAAGAAFAVLAHVAAHERNRSTKPRDE